MITISLFYTYKYIDDWENLNGISLSENEDFCSHLNMEDITDANYVHVKRFCKDFKIKMLGCSKENEIVIGCIREL